MSKFGSDYVVAMTMSIKGTIIIGIVFLNFKSSQFHKAYEAVKNYIFLSYIDQVYVSVVHKRVSLFIHVSIWPVMVNAKNKLTIGLVCSCTNC